MEERHNKKKLPTPENHSQIYRQKRSMRGVFGYSATAFLTANLTLAFRCGVTLTRCAGSASLHGVMVEAPRLSVQGGGGFMAARWDEGFLVYSRGECVTARRYDGGDAVVGRPGGSAFFMAARWAAIFSPRLCVPHALPSPGTSCGCRPFTKPSIYDSREQGDITFVDLCR